MAHTPDGGPAFPLPRNHSSGDALFAPGDGMSLRDYFAAKAIEWMAECTHALAKQSADTGVPLADVVAAVCYELADAMLRARAAQSPRESQDRHLSEFGK